MAGIGEYKLIKLYQYTSSQDASGDNKETLALKYRTYADVEDTGGGRSSERERTTLSNVKRFRIRFRTDWVINGDWKIKYFGQLYTIGKIERINEKRFNWLITAEAK